MEKADKLNNSEMFLEGSLPIAPHFYYKGLVIGLSSLFIKKINQNQPSCFKVKISKLQLIITAATLAIVLILDLARSFISFLEYNFQRQGYIDMLESDFLLGF